MRLTEAQYELIEAYLKQELSTKDQASFEDDMKADAELRAEVDRQRDLRLGLRALGIERALERARAQYKMTVPTADSIDKKPTIVRPLFTWRYWVAAASVVLVLGIGYYGYQQTASRQADMAYAETLAADATDELIKGFPSGGVPAETRTTFLDAFTNYKAGKYDQVIDQLANLPADKQTIHYKNYFLGLSYLANKQTTKAIPLLSKAREAPSSKIRLKADWFLALAYVKTDQKEKALPMLRRISADKTNPFHSLAQQVLRKID